MSLKDTRLRPSGAQGPLVVSLDGFARYQREDAWSWEHMALTRARPVFGAPAARAQVQEVIDAVLAGDRPARDIAADARKMRGDMAAHKPPAGPLDAKLLPGGLVPAYVDLRGRGGAGPALLRRVRGLAGAGQALRGVLPAQEVGREQPRSEHGEEEEGEDQRALHRRPS